MKLSIVFCTSDGLVFEYMVNWFKRFLIKNLCHYNGPIFFPTRRSVLTLLKSPHADKDSRYHMYRRYYKVCFILYDIDRFIVKKIMCINVSPMVFIIIKFLV